ncbi:MAG: mandelate racemase/muconate lactonizing enzyme family protein [Solirubrobacterales bacterium]
MPYALPFAREYRASPGNLDRRELVLLRVRDADGVTGVGEGVPLTLRGGDSLDSVVSTLGGWAERLRLDGHLEPPSGPVPARCAVVTALADLEARREGIPLHELLGDGREPNPVRCNATIGADPPDEVADRARELSELGFDRFKLKVGTGDDRERIEALRASLRPGSMIRLDANGAWTVEEAISFVSEIGSDGLELLEQPTEGLEALAQVKAGTDVPVVADESVSTPEEAAEAAAIDACDAVTVKISKVGGLDGRLGGHLPTYVSSALDGPVGRAAAGHLAATLPETGPTGPTHHGLATLGLFDGTIAAIGPEMEGEVLVLPPGPGTGVEIDESALATFRL